MMSNGPMSGASPQQQEQTVPSANGQPTAATPQSISFLKSLYELHKRRGSPITEPAAVEGKSIDLHKLYTLTMQLGGSSKVHMTGLWPQLLDKLGFERDATGNQPMTRIRDLVTLYQRVLLPLEQALIQQAAKQAQQRKLQQQQEAGSASTSSAAPVASTSSLPQSAGVPIAPAMRSSISQSPLPQPGEQLAPVKQEHIESNVPLSFQSTMPKEETGQPHRHRRKRQRIEYAPIKRPMDATVGGWDLGLWDELIPAVAKRRHQRDLPDLGMIDMHSLTMALRSRLDTEVAYALNVLTLLSVHSAVPGDPRSLIFAFAMAGDLLEEVIELLLDTAIKQADANSNKSSPRIFRTYEDLVKLANEEEGDLRDLTREPLSAERPIRPASLVLALTNFLRNMSFLPDNIVAYSRTPKFVDALLRVASLPLRIDASPKTISSSPLLHLSARESLAVRKDVMQILSVFGLVKDTHVQLRSLDRDAQAMAYELFVSFITPCDLHGPTYFDLSYFPHAVSQLPLSGRQAPYLELGLLVFARVVVLDSNRAVLRALPPPVDLFELFESMVQNLPMTEEQFQRLAHEDGYLAIESLTMSMYNILSFAPSPVKERIRDRPSFAKALVRILKRLSGTTLDPEQNSFGPLCERCIEMLQLIDDSGAPMASAVEADLPWYGLPMWGRDDVDGAFATTSNNDSGSNGGESKFVPPAAGSVKAQGPPKGHRTGPSILASQSDAVFDLLRTSSTALFLKLEPMLNNQTE